MLARPRLPAGAFAFFSSAGLPSGERFKPARIRFDDLQTCMGPPRRKHPSGPTTCRIELPPALMPPGSVLSGMYFVDAQTLRSRLYLRRDRSILPPAPVRDFQRHRPGAHLRSLIRPDSFSLAHRPRLKAQLIATPTAPSGDPIEIGLFRVGHLAARARATLPGLNRTFSEGGPTTSLPPSGRQ